MTIVIDSDLVNFDVRFSYWVLESQYFFKSKPEGKQGAFLPLTFKPNITVEVSGNLLADGQAKTDASRVSILCGLDKPK